MRFASSILLVVLVASGIYAQRRPAKPSPTPNKEISIQTAVTKDGRTVLLKSDGTWEYSTDPVAPTPTPAATPFSASLSIESAIVYRAGGAQPVARTDFVLLDKPVPSTLREEAGLKVCDKDKERDANLYQNRYPSLRQSPREDNDSNLLMDYVAASETLEPQFLSKATKAIAPHIKARVTTDFAGKVTFTDLAPGDYFIFGVVQTRGGRAVWHLPIKVGSGVNSLILDQRNAFVAY